MSLVVRVNEDGSISFPNEMSGTIKPHRQFYVETEGDTIRLVPLSGFQNEVSELQEEARQLWETQTPEQRLKAMQEWFHSPRPAVPDLPDEALRRESIYD